MVLTRFWLRPNGSLMTKERSCFLSIQGQCCTPQLLLFCLTFKISLFEWRLQIKMEWSWEIYILFNGASLCGSKNLPEFCRSDSNNEMHLLHAKYARRDKNADKIVSPKTFRSFFLLGILPENRFSWTEIPCYWCDNTPKMLAADATRVGMF